MMRDPVDMFASYFYHRHPLAVRDKKRLADVPPDELRLSLNQSSFQASWEWWELGGPANSGAFANEQPIGEAFSGGSWIVVKGCGQMTVQNGTETSPLQLCLSHSKRGNVLDICRSDMTQAKAATNQKKKSM
jgi:hypothetical protein